MVICAFAGAKLISLAQTVVIAQVFGIGEEYDAYVVANGLPELIYTLIAGGAHGARLHPVFSGQLARGERRGRGARRRWSSTAFSWSRWC